ncbi:MAG: protein kinase [Candidatus Obscuribacterales bacterium]|jgi:serine/threonine protein kinase
MNGDKEDSAKDNRVDRVDLVGQIIDQKYKVLALLGRGGMGAVYLAHHLRLNKDVALKTFVSTNLSEDIRQRFKREAQAIAKLQHQNIVQVFDFGIADGGLPYYTMEHLDGESVAERIERKGQLELGEALSIFSQLCQGLQLCHRNGVIHRDIKPANIFLELQSSTNDAIAAVKLVDFGIAALTDSAVIENQKLTAAGTVFGSPLYMSPEQSMGKAVDARSDIYSSGCALFEMLTGKPPFRAASALATMLCHQEAAAPTLASIAPEQAYPEWLEALVAKLLAKDPEERLQSLAEAIDVIESQGQTKKSSSQYARDDKYASDQPQSVGRFVAYLVLGLLLVVLGAYLILQEYRAPATKPAVVVEKVRVNPAQIVAYRLPMQKKGTICFRFPDTEIGKIGQGEEKKYKPACGYVEIADGPSVFFRAGQAVCDQPELLSGFGKDDLNILLFDDGIAGTWNNRSAQAVKHLTSLRKITFHSTDFTPAAIDSLNKLPNLVELGLGYSTLSGVDLLKLECLPKLQVLDVIEMREVSPLLARLARANNLFHLTAQECHLSDKDMLAIGHFRMLLKLNLEGNNITNEGVAAVGHLTHLRELNLVGNPIDSDVLPILLKLSPPMKVDMPNSFWNEKTILPMQKRFGSSRVNSVNSTNGL